MFDVGKSYKTREGHIATIRETTRDGSHVIGDMLGGAYSFAWRAVDGRINAGPPDSQYDLMPGAVEEGLG
jgi:hypothetical protein